jgi:hypothetical protein
VCKLGTDRLTAPRSETKAVAHADVLKCQCFNIQPRERKKINELINWNPTRNINTTLFFTFNLLQKHVLSAKFYNNVTKTLWKDWQIKRKCTNTSVFLLPLKWTVLYYMNRSKRLGLLKRNITQWNTTGTYWKRLTKRYVITLQNQRKNQVFSTRNLWQRKNNKIYKI